jgi:hypothetical protein
MDSGESVQEVASLLKGREVMITLGKGIVVRSLALAMATCTGCSMYTAAARNAFLEPAARVNTGLTCIRDHIVAKDVWQTIVDCEPGQTYSTDYGEGFRAGYADYLKEGGPTIPKTMPPYRYWTRAYQTPEGRAAVDDWYAGYQRGATMAHDGPCRDLATVPTIAVLPPSKERVRIADVDYSGTKAEKEASVHDLGEQLPPPRPEK